MEKVSIFTYILFLTTKRCLKTSNVVQLLLASFTVLCRVLNGHVLSVFVGFVRVRVIVTCPCCDFSLCRRVTDVLNVSVRERSVARMPDATGVCFFVATAVVHLRRIARVDRSPWLLEQL